VWTGSKFRPANQHVAHPGPPGREQGRHGYIRFFCIALAFVMRGICIWRGLAAISDAPSAANQEHPAGGMAPAP